MPDYAVKEDADVFLLTVFHFRPMTTSAHVAGDGGENKAGLEARWALGPWASLGRGVEYVIDANRRTFIGHLLVGSRLIFAGYRESVVFHYVANKMRAVVLGTFLAKAEGTDLVDFLSKIAHE